MSKTKTETNTGAELVKGVPIKDIPWDGQRDSRPTVIESGLYTDPNDVFRFSPGTSKSAVKHILPPNTPAHYIDRRRHPERYPPSKEMILGRYIHALLFEPELGKKFVTTPDEDANGKPWTLRSNANKEHYAELQKKYGKEFVLHDKGAKDMYNQAEQIVESIKGREYTAKALAGGYPEVAIYWQDEATGKHCKTKADFLKPLPGDAIMVVEFKTVQMLDPDRFRKTVGDMQYDVDLAFTVDGVRQATGKQVYGLIIGFLKTPPYLTQEYELPADMMATATAHYRVGLEVLQWCYEHDEWMGYSDRPITLDRLLPYQKRLGGDHG